MWNEDEIPGVFTVLVFAALGAAAGVIVTSIVALVALAATVPAWVFAAAFGAPAITGLLVGLAHVGEDAA